MKPQVSGESSMANESRRSVGEKLHRAYKAAVVAITADASSSKQRRLLMCDQRWSHPAEDPIRTLMFLGSWGLGVTHDSWLKTREGFDWTTPCVETLLTWVKTERWICERVTIH